MFKKKKAESPFFSGSSVSLRRRRIKPITFVAAVHAHLAPIWAHVAFHALNARLAGAQARHLLAVVPDRARGVAVARCRKKREQSEGRKEGGGNVRKAAIDC